MGLFGFGKQRLVDRLLAQGVQPLFVALERIHGIYPKDVYQDAYVLGFLNGAVALLTHLESRGTLFSQDRGEVMLDVLRKTFGSVGNQAIRLMLDFQDALDPEFLRGRENAGKLVCLTYGIKTLDDDPEIQQARREFEALRPAFASVTTTADHISGFVGYLQKRLFLDHVTRNVVGR